MSGPGSNGSGAGGGLSLGDWAGPTDSGAGVGAPGADHLISSEVFRAVLPGIWQPLSIPNAPRGTAAFIHPAFGFNLFQVIVTPEPGIQAATPDFVTRAITARMQMLVDNGHAVEPGKLALTKRPHGPVGVCDCVMDQKRYGVMAGHGFRDLVLVHFMDGEVGQEPAVKSNMLALINTVTHAEPPQPDTSGLQLGF